MLGARTAGSPLCGRTPRANRRRQCRGGLVLALLAVVCAFFVIAEWRTKTLVATSSEGSSGAGLAISPDVEQVAPGVGGEAAQFEVGAPGKRFDTFQDYMRSGTSSLFSMLSQHRQAAALLTDKEAEGFLTHDPAGYPKDIEWPGDGLETELPASVVGGALTEYARPYTVSEARSEDSNEKLVAMELRAEYLASPLAPYRLKMLLPHAKIVVVLRDPTERYFSDLRQMLCEEERHIDWPAIDDSFAPPSKVKTYLSEAVLDYSPYDKRCLGEGASSGDLWACHVAAIKTHRPLLQGVYAEQVSRWLRAFGKSQVKIVSSATLFAKPEETAADVAQFAGLSGQSLFEFATDRKAACDPRKQSSTVASAYSKRIEGEPSIRRWYADHNERLADVVGEDYSWNDRLQGMNMGGHRL